MAPRWIRAFRNFRRIREVINCVARVRNWYTLTSRYVGLSSSYPVHIQTRSGSRAELETHHDLVTAWVIFCRDEYEIPRGARLIVDIGANVGLFTLRAAETAQQASIFSVEPFPSCYQRLTLNVDKNQLKSRVTCLKFGVSSQSSTRYMPTTGVSQSNGLLPVDTTAGSDVVSVEVVSLMELLALVKSKVGDSPIDFLKIDVEGAEHDFLTHMPNGSLSNVLQLGIEYHPNGDKQSLFAAITAQGLTCTLDKSFGTNVGVAHFRRNI
jgi:FkbM family methyltransferase